MMDVDELGGLLPEKVCIFGAGSTGVSAYEYLQRNRLSDRVLFFIDNNAGKQERDIFGKKVYPREVLGHYPDIGVIAGTAWFHEVNAALAENRRENALFCYLNFMPPFDNEIFLTDWERLVSCYAPDDGITASTLRLMYSIRTGKSLVQPYETATDLFWDGYPVDAGGGALTVVDCGAYDGDTYKELSGKLGAAIRRYYAFEPNPALASGWRREYGDLMDKGLLRFFPAGVGAESTTSAFHIDATKPVGSSFLGDPGKGESIEIVRLDDLDLEIVGKAYVKMDIEGFERDALAGMKNFIRAHEPELAVCVYHLANDYYHIPELLKEIHPGYTCRLRGGIHTVCWAKVEG